MKLGPRKNAFILCFMVVVAVFSSSMVLGAIAAGFSCSAISSTVDASVLLDDSLAWLAILYARKQEKREGIVAFFHCPEVFRDQWYRKKVVVQHPWDQKLSQTDGGELILPVTYRKRYCARSLLAIPRRRIPTTRTYRIPKYTREIPC